MDTWVWLRPWWLLAYIPVLAIAMYWWFRPQTQSDWHQHCDPRLLNYLQYSHNNRKWIGTWGALLFSMSMMVLALAGPSWQRLATPIGQVQKPVMIVLDLSTSILLDDITPSRLQRAKFLIEDSLKAHPDMQWGLEVFSLMPFLVSPMTNDSENILNFLPVLAPKILPVGGYNPMKALQKASDDILQSGYDKGKIIMIASHPPTDDILNLSDELAKQGMHIAWVEDSSIQRQFKDARLAYMSIKNAHDELSPWLKQGFSLNTASLKTGKTVMQYKDDGRWFLLLAMIPLLAVFRRGWFLRLWV